MVSKAFQVLSGLFFPTLDLLDNCLPDIAVDPQKRTIYDQSGSDPEDRTASRSGFSSTGFGGGGGGGFEGEMSPEDLFNMFFGGGGNFGGGGFGGGGPGTFKFFQHMILSQSILSSFHNDFRTWRFPNCTFRRRR